MTKRLILAYVFLLAYGLTPLTSYAQGPVSDDVPTGFQVEKLADGVFAAIRKEPPALFVDANSVFIINDNGAVVIDANLTPHSARQCLAALRKLTDKPVKYLVLTHWHQDHVAGAQVYKEAFPGLEIIAHSRTRSELAAKGDATRQLYLDQGPAYASQLRDTVNKNVTSTGEPLAPEQRISLLSAAALIDGYIAEAGGMRTVLPTLTFDESLTLTSGARTIEIRYVGRGHTDKDIVVFLPAERILVTGDLVVAPVPLTGDQSFIGDWAATLDVLCKLQPAYIVPGHGPVLRDDSHLKLMSEMLRHIATQTKAAVGRGETLEQARKSVDLELYRKRLTKDSRALNTIFRNFVAGPAVEKAYIEAKPGG